MRYPVLILQLILFFCACPTVSEACTSVIISGSRTSDGRPMMWKHRDTDSLDNKLRFFSGELYDFTGLVNSGSESREVWTGVNTAGFAIMNTASYNLQKTEAPFRDREGYLMFRALEICGGTEDFEHYLDTCSRPLGVEAEFGVIDACGGAAYYEVDNYGWVKYDVNDTLTAPRGYMVVTNFSFSGRPEDRKGYERYLTASAIFAEMTGGGGYYDITPYDIMDGLSRSLRHEVLGTDYIAGYRALEETGYFNGMVVDQDFIPRFSTSSSTVIKGVAPGDSPFGTVIYTLLGYPFTGVTVPIPLCDRDIIPSYMKNDSPGGHSAMCDISLALKHLYVFTREGSNGSHYMDISGIAGHGDSLSVTDMCRRTEEDIAEIFDGLCNARAEGSITDDEFYTQYKIVSETFFNIFISNITPFL